MPSLSAHQSNSFTKLTAEDVVSHFNRPIIVNEHGCWLWLGATDKRGYARFGGHLLVYGFTFRAAGFICEEGKELCHTCSHKNCVNPYHLYAGTHKQNMIDAGNAGVMGRPARVSEEMLRMIPIWLEEGIPKQQIAKNLGVSPQWVSKYLKGGFRYAKA